MRILHTSDWHLGKKLQTKSRLAEQQKTLEELSYVCKNAKVDLVLVAGDIFDTFVPVAQAEELFYSSLLDISRSSSIVVIAGNHDDNERFCAPRGIARASGIYLVGGLDNSSLRGKNAVCDEGFIRLNVGDEFVNLALLPYPSFTRTPRLSEMEGDTFEQKVKSLIDTCCSGFRENEINIFMSHLFMSGSEAVDGELGGAQLLSTSVLPKSTYTALGHIHKPQTASKSKRAYYSGSLLNYSFDDNYKKRHILIDTDGKSFALEDIPITTGRMPVRVRAKNICEALDLLSKNEGCLVELTYTGSEPLRPSDVARLKAFDCFCKLNIESVFVKSEARSRQDKSTEQLFREFYHESHGSLPDDSIVDLFLRVISGEEI